MSKNNETKVEVQTSKAAKVILRKPAGAKDSMGWVGEVIHTDGKREFVPELFKEVWTDQELAMTKIGNLVKAIADCTNYAAQKGYRYSGIIGKHGLACLQQWDAYAKAVQNRKDARDKITGTPEEKKEAWEKIKGPFNSAVRSQMLKMELLTEEILQGEPKKALN